jgi:hypothetical protein
MPTSDGEVAANNSGSNTPLSVASTPSLSDHNSDIFVEMDGAEDMQLSASSNVQYDSDGSNTGAPDMTINRNIEPNVNAIADKIIPSSEPAPSLSVRTNDNPIADNIVPAYSPAPLLSGQRNSAPELAKIDDNSRASRWPKRTIKPKVRADQADISDNDCANLDCEDLKAPREMIMCAGLGCQSKVSLMLSCAVLWHVVLI